MNVDTQELGLLMQRYLKTPSNEKLGRKLCGFAGEIQPAYKRLLHRNMRCGEGFPDDLRILGVLAGRAVEQHPDIYSNIRLRQLEQRIGIGLQWDNACKFGVPISRIDPATMRLLLDCKAPTDTPLWKEQTTPRFPSQYYVLPKGMLEVDKKEVLLLGVTIMTPEELVAQTDEIILKAGMKLPTIANPGAGMFLVSAFTHGTEEYYTRQPIIDGMIKEFNTFHDHSGIGATTSEMDFSGKLLSIGMQILLLENTYPEWHTPEQEKNTTSGSGRPVKEFRPRLIGGKFPHRGLMGTGTRTETGEDGRKRPCEHWCGSHWKSVHHGPKNSLTKRKLILPYIVNPGLE